MGADTLVGPFQRCQGASLDPFPGVKGEGERAFLALSFRIINKYIWDYLIIWEQSVKSGLLLSLFTPEGHNGPLGTPTHTLLATLPPDQSAFF